MQVSITIFESDNFTFLYLRKTLTVVPSQIDVRRKLNRRFTESTTLLKCTTPSQKLTA